MVSDFAAVCWGIGQVLWTCTGRNKALTPTTSLPGMDEVAGVNTASLGGCPNSSKTMAKWAEGFHDELNGHVFDLEKDGLHLALELPWWRTEKNGGNWL